MLGLQIRKLADTSSGERVVRYHPETGEKQLVNPRTGQAEPWPLLGVELEVAPDETGISTTALEVGRREGWITVEGESPVVRPGGPTDDKYRVTHTFVHIDKIIFKTLSGDVTYKVVHQPDKYADDRVPDERGMLSSEDDVLEDDEPVTDERYAAGETRVDWWYGLKKVDSNG